MARGHDRAAAAGTAPLACTNPSVLQNEGAPSSIGIDIVVRLAGYHMAHMLEQNKGAH